MMVIYVFIISFLCLQTTSASEYLRSLPPSLQDEVYLTVPEIIAKYNYSVEVHNVVTEDGYILTLHRILSSRKTTKSSVLLMHGIVSSSADWIITGPKNGLGYILADEGYDVWLGNARGNRYSRKHTTLDPQSSKFWDFSWHEIGFYDIPAIVDYILTNVKQKQIFYIGHSQGTTVFYVMCSLRPEYNEKIKAQFSLAPIAFVGHLASPLLRFLAHISFMIKYVAEWFSLNEILPKDGLINILGSKMCGINHITEILCGNALFAIGGFNLKHLNTTMLPLILAHVPAGSSTKQLLHFTQEIKSGHFRQYDYGLWQNLKLYHHLKPTDYNLNNISVPIYFFYSKNDWVSSAIDVSTLSKQLKSLRGAFLVADGLFTHIDFMFAMDAPKVLYKRILSLMTKH